MSFLEKVIRGVQFMGLRNTLATIHGSISRDWVEFRYREKKSEQSPKRPGWLEETETLENGVHFRFQNAKLTVEFLAPDLARLTWEPGVLPFPYALVDKDWQGPKLKVEEGDGYWALSSKKLTIQVRFDGAVSFIDRDGKTLRSEAPPSLAGEAWTHRAGLNPGDRIYGLGERAANLNLRPGTYRMWNEDPGGSYSTGADPLYISIPLYLTLKEDAGCLVFYENTFDGTMIFPPSQEDSPPVFSEARFEGGALRYYFIPGLPAESLTRFADLTGRAPFPPRWSLGYHQCRWGYKSEEDIREVISGFKEHNLPVSVIHLDIDYMDGFRLFTIDESRYPDLPGLTDDLEADGIKAITIMDVGVKEDPAYALYRDGIELGMFVSLPDGKPVRSRVWPGWCSFPDLTADKTRNWWADQYPFLLDAGAAGIWHDMNEPAAFVAWGDPTLPKVARYAFEGRGGDHREANNLIGLLINQVGFESLRKHRPEKRPWILYRSGWAGMQRFAWNWTGDVESTWKALRQTLVTMLGLGLSGIPYTGSDIGGFSGNPDGELFIRWFQLSTFTAFFRGHSAAGTARREPWVFGEPFTGIVRKFLELRYALMPYFYTLAWEIQKSNAPFIRPMLWAYPDHPELSRVEDAFMVGDHLLAAPVLKQGAVEREVMIPPGTWYSFWDGERYKGDKKVVIDTPLDRMPLLVRGGSVLPITHDDHLKLRIFSPPKDKKDAVLSHLYSDAGDGYGDWRLDTFHVRFDDGELIVTRTYDGDYPFPYDGIDVSVTGFPFMEVMVDGKSHIVDTLLQVEDFQELRFLPKKNKKKPKKTK